MIIKNKIDWKALSEISNSKELSSKKIMILDESLKIISSEGIHSLGVTKISQTTGLSKSLILYHYQNIGLIIEDLIFFSFKMSQYFIQENLNKEDSFEKKISSMVKSLFKWALYNNEVSDFFLLIPFQANKSEQSKKVYSQMKQYHQECWEKIFLESMRYKSLEEVKIHTKGIQDLIIGRLTDMIATESSLSYQEDLQTLKFNIESLLRIELPHISFFSDSL